MHEFIKQFGSLHPLPESIPLRAGNLTMLYESGFLRYIKNGDIEILRMINHLIRDKNWSTIPMEILSEQVERNEASFSIAYTARCEQDDIQFHWICSIVGREDGSITFNISGEALHPFKRNRLGFTVLHPIETSVGKSCLLTHADGSTEELSFPELISPHQPFVDMKAMRWSPAPGIEVSLDFEGDLFETEDQRNWMDASFKTYCTPLTKPFPHQVNTGDKVDQTIEFKIYGELTPAQDAPERALSFVVNNDQLTDLPKIGIPMSALSQDAFTIDAIKALNADFIGVTIREGMDISDRMQRALAFDLNLQVVLFIPKNNDLDFVKHMLPHRDRISQFIVLPDYAKSADESLLKKIGPLLRENFPNSRIGSGTDLFFTELNRQRTPSTTLDFLSFSVNPQAHAPDMRTMTENLIAHRDIITSCRSFTERDVHVGPVTLRTRSNPSVTHEPSNGLQGKLPPDVDPRQLSLYGAAWTLGSIKYLAESGVGAVTYYETSGWRGLVSHPDEPWPADFDIKQRTVYPLYNVLQEVLKHKTEKVARLTSSAPLKFDGIAFLNVSGTETIILANYTDQPIIINLSPAKTVTLDPFTIVTI